MPIQSKKEKALQIKKEHNVQICCFPYLLTLKSSIIKLLFKLHFEWNVMST